jgi:hypothetical protein
VPRLVAINLDLREHPKKNFSLILLGGKVFRISEFPNFRESVLAAPAEIQKLREIYKEDEREGLNYDWLAIEFAARRS